MKKTLLLGFSLLLGAGVMSAAPADGVRKHAPVPRRSVARSAVPSAEVSAARLPRISAAGAVRNSVAKVGPSGSTIYGWLGFTTERDARIGLSEMYPDGTYSAPIAVNDNEIGAAFIRDGKAYVYNTVTIAVLDIFVENNLSVYNLETGALENTITLTTDDYSQYVLGAAYDAKADRIYGYTFTPDGEHYCFFSAPGNDPKAFTYTTVDDPMMSMTWNQITDKLIGITMEGDMVEINKANGALTHLAKAPVVPAYFTGLCYSPIDNCYYWNSNVEDAQENVTSSLYSISADDYTFTKICDYPKEEEFMSMMCTDTRAVDREAPAAPTVQNAILGTEEPQLLVFYGIPDKTFGGTPITERMDYIAEVDGQEYTSGTVAPGNNGAPFMINYIDVSEGMHTISLTLSLNGKQGLPAVITRYLGFDTPKAPANVVLTDKGVSWDAVTEGVNEGVIDEYGLTYTVSVDDVVVAENVKGTSIDYVVPEGELAMHYASVKAVNHGHVSEAGISENVAMGSPLRLPQTITPTEAQYQLGTILDVNDDGRSFSFQKDPLGNDSYCYIYAAENNGNDYAVLPPMNFSKGGAVYSIELDAMSSNAQTPEAFEVYIGKTPEAAAMTRCILPRTTVATDREYAKVSALFTVEEAGTYYVALKCVSDKDALYLYLRNITVAETAVPAAAPAAVTGLQAVAADKGELSASVTFTLPSLSIAGNALPDADIEVLVASPVAQQKLSGRPGTTVSTSIATQQGDNEITVTSLTADGQSGASADIDVFTGIVRPGNVKNLAFDVSEDDMTVNISWAPAEAAVEGGYCPADGIRYRIGRQVDYEWTFDIVTEPGATSVTVPLGEGARQALYVFGVMAENDGGRADEFLTGGLIAGTPYETEFKETFSQVGCTFGPMVRMRLDESYTALINYIDPAQLGEEYALEGNAGALSFMIDDWGGTAPANGLVGLPKVSTLDTFRPAFRLTYGYGQGGEIEVLASTYGDQEPTVIGKISELDKDNQTAGYHTVDIQLPEHFRNRPWVQFYIRVHLATAADLVVIPTYSVLDLGDDAVEGIAEQNVSVYATRGAIHALGFTEGRLQVVALDGRSVATAPAAHEVTFSVAPGLYILRTPRGSYKLLVK